MAISITVDKTLDIQGLLCPRPKMLTLATLENMKPGQVLRVITSDRSTKQTIPSLCSINGYNLLECREDDEGILYYIIRK